LKRNNQKIWLTGSRGFIGRHLVAELKDVCELKCLSNRKFENSSSHENNQPFYVNFKDEDDIKNAIESLGLPDVFIHLGWGDMANPHSEMHLVENVNQSKNLIDVLYKEGLKKFIFLGSMNEYGDRLGSLYEEMGPEGEITNYAKGKIEVAKYGFQKS